MLEKVQGIVLRTVKFNDSKLIVDMFTLGHGRLSFVASVSHSRQSKGQMAFWAPLSMVEFQADIRPGTPHMPKPKDVRLYYTYMDVPYNPLKSTVALFLAEFLSASLRSEMENVPLFRFLETSLMWFDNQANASRLANFHLIFMYRMTRFLGIYPNLDMPSGVSASVPYDRNGNYKSEEYPYFDLQAASYTYLLPNHSNFILPKESSNVVLLSRLNYSTMHLMRLSRSQRSRIVDLLITYYRLHLPSFPELKSLDVLGEVFA